MIRHVNEVHLTIRLEILACLISNEIHCLVSHLILIVLNSLRLFKNCLRQLTVSINNRLYGTVPDLEQTDDFPIHSDFIQNYLGFFSPKNILVNGIMMVTVMQPFSDKRSYRGTVKINGTLYQKVVPWSPHT